MKHTLKHVSLVHHHMNRRGLLKKDAMRKVGIYDSGKYYRLLKRLGVREGLQLRKLPPSKKSTLLQGKYSIYTLADVLTVHRHVNENKLTKNEAMKKGGFRNSSAYYPALKRLGVREEIIALPTNYYKFI